MHEQREIRAGKPRAPGMSKDKRYRARGTLAAPTRMQPEEKAPPIPSVMLSGGFFMPKCPLYDSCGRAGGGPHPTGGKGEYVNTSYAKFGQLGSSLPKQPSGAVWRAGEVVETSSSSRGRDARVQAARAERAVDVGHHRLGLRGLRHAAQAALRARGQRQGRALRVDAP